MKPSKPSVSDRNARYPGSNDCPERRSNAASAPGSAGGRITGRGLAPTGESAKYSLARSATI